MLLLYYYPLWGLHGSSRAEAVCVPVNKHADGLRWSMDRIVKLTEFHRNAFFDVNERNIGGHWRKAFTVLSGFEYLVPRHNLIVDE